MVTDYTEHFQAALRVHAISAEVMHVDQALATAGLSVVSVCLPMTSSALPGQVLLSLEPFVADVIRAAGEGREMPKGGVFAAMAALAAEASKSSRHGGAGGG
jgi:hypothetical protein